MNPRPASSVILLRRGGRHQDHGVEVCMVLRNPEARFMPGVWVFPGGAVDAADGADEAAHRSCAVRELHEEAGIELDPGELVLYSRWITPEAVPVRFDTYFYVALAPAHAPPRPDGEETVDAAWFSPRDALGRHRTGNLPLVFPTIKHIESLLEFRRAEAVIEAARGREVKPVIPRVVGEGGDRRIVVD